MRNSLLFVAVIFVLAFMVTPAIAQSGHEIDLSWSAPNSTCTVPMTYSVYRATTSGGETKPALATGVTTAAYNDLNVLAGIVYYYKVTAVCQPDTPPESAFSSETSAIVNPPNPPGAPVAKVVQ